MKLFLDANLVFTAAHNPRGKAAQIIDLGVEGHWRLFTSSYAREEVKRNLALKFPLALVRLDELLHEVRIVEHSPGLPYPSGLATKDIPIFQAAVASGATHLLTGDLKDFGAFMDQPDETFGVLVQTAAAFLDSLVQGAAPPAVPD